MEDGDRPNGVRDVQEAPSPEQNDLKAEEWERRKAEIVERARRRANPRRIRPLGVMVLSMLLAIYSVCLLVGTLWTFSHLDEVRASIASQEDSGDVAWVVVIAIPFQMMAAAAISYGLWDLEGWARYSMVGFAAMGLTRESASLAYPPFVTPYLPGLGLSPAWGLHLAAVIGLWIYLQSSDVRTAFSENRKFGD
jgi:hypothetical protein